MTGARTSEFFALSGRPPDEVEIAGESLHLVKVFKHDFFAATCLYGRGGRMVVVKFLRTRDFYGLTMGWLGRFLLARESIFYADLKGVDGVPALLGQIAPCGLAIEYVDARPLDCYSLAEPPPKGFFDALRGLFDEIHARGVAYCDANKRSNILVTPEGRPALVDFQISIRRRDDLPWPLRAMARACVKYVSRSDLYHLYKHKRRLCPDELTDDERLLSTRRGLLHSLHTRLTDPWRTVRRRFLKSQADHGRLASPTADLEDEARSEGSTWQRVRQRQQRGR